MNHSATIIHPLITLFNYSAGVLLLGVAAGLFLCNLTGPSGIIPPNDPIFQIPMPHLYWIIGMLCLLMALLCLFGENLMNQMLALAWLMMILLAYRESIIYRGTPSVTGYFGTVSQTFGMSISTLIVVGEILGAYLLLGACISAAYIFFTKAASVSGLLRMACPACTGHIAFPHQRLGEKTPCPHCQTDIVL